MTVQDLYDWAAENKCLDVQISKHMDMDFLDVSTVTHLMEVFPEMYSGVNDRVVID